MLHTKVPIEGPLPSAPSTRPVSRPNHYQHSYLPSLDTLAGRTCQRAIEEGRARNKSASFDLASGKPPLIPRSAPLRIADVDKELSACRREQTRLMAILLFYRYRQNARRRLLRELQEMAQIVIAAFARFHDTEAEICAAMSREGIGGGDWDAGETAAHPAFRRGGGGK